MSLLLSLLAGSAIKGYSTKRSAELHRNAAKKERDAHFQNLRDSAQRAGFNPLTVLRATGGGGYGGYVPLLSRSAGGAGIAAAGDYASKMIGDNYFAEKKMAHETRLNKSNQQAADRRLNKEIANRPDSGFNYDKVDYIHVKFGHKVIKLDAGIAERLRIKPYGKLMAEDLQAMFGEIHGNILSGLATKALDDIIIGSDAMYSLLGGDDRDANREINQEIVVETLDPEAEKLRNSGWFRNAIEAIDAPYQGFTRDEVKDGWAAESAKYAGR